MIFLDSILYHCHFLFELCMALVFECHDLIGARAKKFFEANFYNSLIYLNNR